jgi:DNA-binding protein H-NS
MVMKSKTKKLKLELKNLETDMLKTYKKIADLYQKMEHLQIEEFKEEINDLINIAEISEVDEITGYDKYFVTTKGDKNKVNRKALVDKYGNCVLQGYREII